MPSIEQPPNTGSNLQASSTEQRRDLIATIAISDPELNLVRRIYKGLNGEKAVQLFGTGSSALFSIGHDYIKAHLNEPDTMSHVLEFLKGTDHGRTALLKTLCSIPLPANPDLKEMLLHLARNEATVISELATKAICFRYPEMISSLTSDINSGIRFGLCFSKNTAVIPDLIASWGREQVVKSPPVALGLLMTPQALGNIWLKDSELGMALARAYGYFDNAADDPAPALHAELCAKLLGGLMLTDPLFCSHDLEDLQARELSLIRTLLPWSTGMNGPAPTGFSLEQPIDQLLFILAVRSAEKTNFDVRVDEKPHTERGRENLRWLEFAYAPLSYAKQQLIHLPRKSFTELGGAPEHFSQYALEYANCRLERDGQLQDEQRLFLEARWSHAARKGVRPAIVRDFPVQDDSAHLEISELVLPERPKIFTGRMERISHGGNSARKLLLYTNRGELTSTLEKVEQHFSGLLPPIGIEIQCPFPAERSAESFSWKQALRSFGIPSPRRPEYRSLVEAAFLPAFSYHAHITSLLLLKELGLFKKGEDLALHISLSGKLGPEVRYLLFTQQFAAAPTSSPPGSKLMSKGFAHLHQDAVDPVSSGPNKLNPFRTELRSMRINNSELLGDRFPHFIDDILTFQMLGGALASSHPTLQEIWSSFAETVRRYTDSLPKEFETLLDADWYESTGDSSDPHLMPLLDIVTKRQQVGLWIKQNQKSEVLRKDFRQIRNDHARAVFEALPRSSIYSNAPSHFALSDAGIPFLNPLSQDI